MTGWNGEQWDFQNNEKTMEHSILFIIYINDLPKCVSYDTTMAMFADDTKCHRPIKNSQDKETLQSDLDNITTLQHN